MKNTYIMKPTEFYKNYRHLGKYLDSMAEYLKTLSTLQEYIFDFNIENMELPRLIDVTEKFRNAKSDILYKVFPGAENNHYTKVEGAYKSLSKAAQDAIKYTFCVNLLYNNVSVRTAAKECNISHEKGYQILEEALIKLTEEAE